MNDDTEINIEIQLSYMKSWADRSTFYVAKMLTEQVGINQRYTNIRKCIAINILDFPYIKDDVRFHTVYHISEDTSHSRFTDVMEWHIVELPKLPKVDDGTDLYQWARFISAEKEEEFKMLAKHDEYIGAAVAQLEVISQDEQMRMEYNARKKALYDYNTLMDERLEEGIEIGEARGEAKGIAIGEARGIEIGKAEGIGIGYAKAQNALAATMRKRGMSEEEIQEFFAETGMQEDE